MYPRRYGPGTGLGPAEIKKCPVTLNNASDYRANG